MSESMSEERWKEIGVVLLNATAEIAAEGEGTLPAATMLVNDSVPKLLAEVKRLREEAARRGCVQSEAEE